MSKDKEIIGRLQELSVTEIKKIWPSEEKDMSPWIMNNIDAVNSTLGLQIEIEELEKPVESFRLDLSGTDGLTQKPVVIENQFGATDHDHLGKLITYSAHQEAGILIWVANNFHNPHKKALEWLNNITGEDMLFYGLKLEVFRIDDSKPAPRFTIIVEPPLSKRPRINSSELTEREKAYKAFWDKFLSTLSSKYPDVTKAKLGQPQSWLALGAGRSGFALSSCFTSESLFRVEIYIDVGNKESNEKAFSMLKDSEDKIHSELGEQLIWDPIVEKRACRIYFPCMENVTIDSPQEKLGELITKGAEWNKKFKDVFGKRIKALDIE